MQEERINGVSLLTEFTLLLQDASRDEGMASAAQTDALLNEAKELLNKHLSKDSRGNKKTKDLLRGMSKLVSAITPANMLVRTPRGDRKTLTLSALVPAIMTTDKKLMKTLEQLIPDDFVPDELNLQQQEAFKLIQNMINVVSYEQELANKMILVMAGEAVGHNVDTEAMEMYRLLESYEKVTERLERYVVKAKSHSRDILKISPTKITDVNRHMFLNAFAMYPDLFKNISIRNIGFKKTVTKTVTGIFTKASQASRGAVLGFGLVTALIFAVVSITAGKAMYENMRVAQGRRYQAQIRSLRLLRVELESGGTNASSTTKKELTIVNEEIRRLGNALKRMGAST